MNDVPLVNIMDLHPGVWIRCAEWIGIVVFNNCTKEYADGYDSNWDYLGDGFMTEFDKAGLVFHREVDEDIIIITENDAANQSLKGRM